MASITSWVRLEPRARDPQLLAGVEARLHDPLWLLARQWQLGELDGVDGGSAMFARTRAELAPIAAVRTADGAAWTPIDPATTPLEAVALAPAPDAAGALDRRARAGRGLLRQLTGAALGQHAGAFVRVFPLTADAAGLDDAERRYLAVVGRRVPDGDAVAAALRAGTLAADLGLDGAPDAGAVITATTAWAASVDAFRHTTAAPAWRPDQLAYRFEARADAATRDLHLVAPRHAGGALAWHDVDITAGDAAARQPIERVSTTIPSQVRYRGMPARRYWELEDAAVHWPSIDAGPGDVARLLFVEFGLVFSSGWLVVPLELPAGSLARVTSLVVTDTFGVHTLIEPADGGSAASPWHFCELSRADGVDGPQLFVPPASGPALVGPALAAVDFARDEAANLMWAIDRVALGGDGRPREVAPPSAPAPGSRSLTYRVGPRLDQRFHPYQLERDERGITLTLARVPDRAPPVARPDLPAQLSLAAVPARPMRLSASATLIRAADGSQHLVTVRATAPVASGPAPAVAFDQLEEAP